MAGSVGGPRSRRRRSCRMGGSRAGASPARDVGSRGGSHRVGGRQQGVLHHAALGARGYRTERAAFVEDGEGVAAPLLPDGRHAAHVAVEHLRLCLLYTSPSPRDAHES
eukprot:3330536-Prymnesium_polylepis.1